MDYLETILALTSDRMNDAVTNTKWGIFNFFNEETSTTRKDFLTACTICALIGIIIGFVFSPIRKGIYFNVSNNGNNALDDEDDDKKCKKSCKKKSKQACKNDCE